MQISRAARRHCVVEWCLSPLKTQKPPNPSWVTLQDGVYKSIIIQATWNSHPLPLKSLAHTASLLLPRFRFPRLFGERWSNAPAPSIRWANGREAEGESPAWRTITTIPLLMIISPPCFMASVIHSWKTLGSKWWLCYVTPGRKCYTYRPKFPTKRECTCEKTFRIKSDRLRGQCSVVREFVCVKLFVAVVVGQLQWVCSCVWVRAAVSGYLQTTGSDNTCYSDCHIFYWDLVCNFLIVYYHYDYLLLV